MYVRAQRLVVVVLLWCHVPTVTAVEDKRRRNRKQPDWPLTGGDAPTGSLSPPSAAVVTPDNQTAILSKYIAGTKYIRPDYVQKGCKELRSKRYISDGYCTSAKPISEVICTGICLPIRQLPWYAELVKFQSRIKAIEWRCVDHDVRKRKIRLVCPNGETRTYRIKVVKGCKCKRYVASQNNTGTKFNTLRNNRRRERMRRKRKRRRKKGKKGRTGGKKKRRRPPTEL